MSPLREILEANTRAPVNYMKLEAAILAWHKAELERYGEKVRDECREWVKFHALKNDDGRLTVGAGVLNLMPLPPIDREGASRE
jgi:head-tail adaptor